MRSGYRPPDALALIYVHQSQTSSSINLEGNKSTPQEGLITTCIGVCFPNFPFETDNLKRDNSCLLRKGAALSSATPGKPVWIGWRQSY